MNDSRAAALDTIRRCVEGLVRNPSADERSRLACLHEAAARVLEQAAIRSTTLQRIDQLKTLEGQLCHMDSGARAFAIQSRMQICRSVYYRLRRRIT